MPRPICLCVLIVTLVIASVTYAAQKWTLSARSQGVVIKPVQPAAWVNVAETVTLRAEDKAGRPAPAATGWSCSQPTWISSTTGVQIIFAPPPGSAGTDEITVSAAVPDDL